MFKRPKTIAYKDGCLVEVITDTSLRVKFQNKEFVLSEDNKMIFSLDTGETVTEYYGLTIDKNAKQSFAKAHFKPKGFSPLHHHQQMTEDYYVLEGEAHIMIDGITHILTAGEHIQILPGQRHQVVNQSEEQVLNILVLCVPAWNEADHILVPDAEISIRFGLKK